MIRLHGFRGTRATRVEWLLQELGVPYEFVLVDLRKGEHKQDPYARLHPHSYVPYLEDGDLRMIESAAMCLHLADKYSDTGMAPPPGTAQRARYYELIVHAVSMLDENVIPMYFHLHILPPEKRDPKVVEKCKPRWLEAATFLEERLGDGPFLLGHKFTAADAAVGYDLFLALKVGLLDGHPKLKAYTERLAERPAFQKALSG